MSGTLQRGQIFELMPASSPLTICMVGDKNKFRAVLSERRLSRQPDARLVTMRISLRMFGQNLPSASNPYQKVAFGFVRDGYCKIRIALRFLAIPVRCHTSAIQAAIFHSRLRLVSLLLQPSCIGGFPRYKMGASFPHYLDG